TRLDRAKPESSFGIGEDAAEPGKPGIGHRRPGGRLRITPVRIGLPDLEHRIGDGLCVAVDHAPLDRDLLPGHDCDGQVVGRGPRNPDVQERTDGLRRRRHGVSTGTSTSIGVASRPRRTMSNVYPSAWSGTVVSQSKVPINRRRARSSRMLVYIGSKSSSGSPGKYICVTRRVTNAGPNSEKWMCAGRHALGWLRHG